MSQGGVVNPLAFCIFPPCITRAKPLKNNNFIYASAQIIIAFPLHGIPQMRNFSLQLKRNRNPLKNKKP